MNIYIKPANEQKLRNEPSMSGLINRLLSEHYAGQEQGTPTPIESQEAEASREEKVVTAENEYVPDYLDRENDDE